MMNKFMLINMSRGWGDKINYKRIQSIIVAFIVFLVIVFIISALANFAGEKSPTGPVKIFSWLCGSLVAFKIFELINDKKEDVEK